MESSERLGRHRWVVERTVAWLTRYRRLSVRYERRADIHEAFLLLTCSLVCLGYLLQSRFRNEHLVGVAAVGIEPSRTEQKTQVEQSRYFGMNERNLLAG